MYLLGISAFYHDSAAALIKDGNIIAAAQEERFTRKKHDEGMPHQAIAYCLDEAGIKFEDIDYICFYDKPFLKFERILETYLSEAPNGFKSFLFSMPMWLKEKIFLKQILINELFDFVLSKLSEGEKINKKTQKKIKKSIETKLRFCEHHQSHAASAFYPSPYKDAAILTIDGVGEWTTTSIAKGDGQKIEVLKEIHFPHSLGLLYSAFTYYTGFKVNSGEYKVMGLAPYGKPTYVDLIKKYLIDIKEDGSFKLDMSYFGHTTGLAMTTEKFHKLFGAPPREREGELTQREMDLAASIQKVTEEVMIKLARHAQEISNSKNLCLAGGVALNCVGNGKILEERIFENIWIQPAAGDAGGALGAALYVYHHELNNKREATISYDKMKGSLLGPAFSNQEVQNRLQKLGANYTYIEEENKLINEICQALEEGKVVGWHQGRMEFGPRALGSRSIIGDPRNTQMQTTMNLKIKYRESFRPFAPSVLKDKANEWFDLEENSPYMLLVAPVNSAKHNQISQEQQKDLFGIEKLKIPRSQIPAVTHVDYSARVQTVDEHSNPRYFKLIKSFNQRTQCPVVVNTSFNVRGEPIVCTPEDSYRCFMRTEMDILVVENCLLEKTKQPKYQEMSNWRDEFELD